MKNNEDNLGKAKNSSPSTLELIALDYFKNKLLICIPLKHERMCKNNESRLGT